MLTVPAYLPEGSEKHVTKACIIPQRKPRESTDMTSNPGTLYVVATPIGNLEDLSPRARATLAAVDLVAAEDTRHTGRLLKHFGIETRQLALHDHNEQEAVPKVVGLLQEGRSVALVSDAGTPLVSDPGYRLVDAAHANDIPVVAIPGPSATIAAVSAAGLPSDRFSFEGFLPSKTEARRTVLNQLATEPRTMVFYESVHRVAATLQDMADAFGADRLAFIGREISKAHEQNVRGTLAELLAAVQHGDIVSKGEFVVVVAGQPPADEEGAVDASRLLTELVAVLPGKQAVEIVSRISGRKKNDLYKEMLALKNAE